MYFRKSAVMIRLQKVSRSYATKRGEVIALPEFDCEIEKGEFVSIVGPSGSGKSTLLLMMGAMLRPTAGTVELNRRDLYSLSPGARARLRSTEIGFVFQMFHLVTYLSVLDNILIAARELDATAALQKAEKLIDEMGLSHRIGHKPSELSAGERQRAAIARALITSPKLILADEPTGNLDPENADEAVKHLKKFQTDGGTVVMVTHGTAADQAADRVIRLRQQ
jgi:putative ABC transport system ATP-binding protein